MGSDSSTESPAPAHPYAWWLQLRVPSAEERRAGQLITSASEQMFFIGAPLAHVVCYEEHRRAKQRRGLPHARTRKARFPLDEESSGRLVLERDRQMTCGLETRGSSREHVLLLAQLSTDDGSAPQRIRIRDLSARGLRAEGDVPVTPGQLVEVDFGLAGKVTGVFAWKDSGLFGVALEQEIDPAIVCRATIQKCEGSYEAPRFVRHLSKTEKTCGPTRKV